MVNILSSQSQVFGNGKKRTLCAHITVHSVWYTETISGYEAIKMNIYGYIPAETSYV